MTREAYSHEVSTAGFWPGGGMVDYPAIYSYAAPALAGRGRPDDPEGAFFHDGIAEFLRLTIDTLVIRSRRLLRFETTIAAGGDVRGG